MNIGIIGTGYVGLVSGACLASKSHKVVCFDIDDVKIQTLNNGNIPIFEPGLGDLVSQEIKSGNLIFTTDKQKLSEAQVVFLCVGTPSQQDGSADLSFLFQAVDDIAPYLSDSCVLVSKSTVPVGTVKKISEKHLFVASNPEFLREGNAVSDFLNPDRIVIGANDARVFEVMREVYKDFNCTKLETTLESAEMIKYASNAFLATKISFINEIANICEQTGADVLEVAKGMGLDSRIGSSFLKAGLGYGGSCFPKDVRALNQIAGLSGYDFKLLKAVIEVNNDQRWRFYNKINTALGSVKDKNIAILGLAFKAGTDDIRESIGIDFAKRFVDQGAKVSVYDTHALESARTILNEVVFADSIIEATKDADAIVVTTDAQEFADADWNAIYKIMRGKFIFDGRNVLTQNKLNEIGFKYNRIGF
jgi:UDPglucose 6-dehydrogenase